MTRNEHGSSILEVLNDNIDPQLKATTVLAAVGFYDSGYLKCDMNHSILYFVNK